MTKTHLFFDSRDRDFIRVCRSLMDGPRGMAITSLRELAEAALACGAPRYYVDIDFAYNMLMRMKVAGVVPSRPKARKMWEEIAAKVGVVMRTHKKISLIRAVTEVIVREPASGFFIEPVTALRILRRYNRRCKSRPFSFPRSK
ncbi:MAG: hypothetical protein HDS41_00885 [Bacteroides sp.]|nr:hypothetical protein [Bacteroides sp.]